MAPAPSAPAGGSTFLGTPAFGTAPFSPVQASGSATAVPPGVLPVVGVSASTAGGPAASVGAAESGSYLVGGPGKSLNVKPGTVVGDSTQVTWLDDAKAGLLAAAEAYESWAYQLLPAEWVDALEEGLLTAAATARTAARVAAPAVEEVAVRGAEAAVAAWNAASPAVGAAAKSAGAAAKVTHSAAVVAGATALSLGSKAVSTASATSVAAAQSAKQLGGTAAAALTKVQAQHGGVVHEVASRAAQVPKAAMDALEAHAPVVLDAADTALDTVEHVVMPVARDATRTLAARVSGIASAAAAATAAATQRAGLVGRKSAPAAAGAGKKDKAQRVISKNEKEIARNGGKQHPPPKTLPVALPPLPMALPVALPALPPLPPLPPLPSPPPLPALPPPVMSAADATAKSFSAGVQAILRSLEHSMTLIPRRERAVESKGQGVAATTQSTPRSGGFALGTALFYALLVAGAKARCDVASSQERAAVAAIGAHLAAFGSRLGDETKRLALRALQAGGLTHARGTLRLKVAVWEATGRMGARLHWHKSADLIASTADTAAPKQCSHVNGVPAAPGADVYAADVAAPLPPPVSTPRASVGTSRKAALIALVAAPDEDEDETEEDRARAARALAAISRRDSAGTTGESTADGVEAAAGGKEEALDAPVERVVSMQLRVWHAMTRPVELRIPRWLGDAASGAASSKTVQGFAGAGSSLMVRALTILADAERSATLAAAAAAREASVAVDKCASAMTHRSETGVAALKALGVDPATVVVSSLEVWSLPSAVPTHGAKRGWRGWALIPAVSFRFALSWDWLPRPPAPPAAEKEKRAAAKAEQKAPAAAANGTHFVDDTSNGGVEAMKARLQASTSASSLGGPPTPPASPPWVKPSAATADAGAGTAATTTTPAAKSTAQTVAAASPTPSVLKAAAAFGAVSATKLSTPDESSKTQGEGSVAERRAMFAAAGKSPSVSEKSTPGSAATKSAKAEGGAPTPGSIAALLAKFENK
jgi:hypothetical protein